MRLNGALIDTIAFPAHGNAIRGAVSLPGELLDVANTLEFDFTDACGSRIQCDDPAAAPRLAAASNFAWWGIGSWRGAIGEIVALDGPVAIELIDSTPEIARTAARMLAAMARHTRTLPDVYHAIQCSQMMVALRGIAGRGIPANRLRSLSRSLPHPFDAPWTIVDRTAPRTIAAGPVTADPNATAPPVTARPGKPLVTLQYQAGTPRTLVLHATPAADPGAGGGRVRAAVLIGSLAADEGRYVHRRCTRRWRAG